MSDLVCIHIYRSLVLVKFNGENIPEKIDDQRL